MKLEILHPHGPCAGVNAAIRTALDLRGAYCLHALVHSEIVTEELKARGYRFVEDIEDVPDGETVLFSAHGVAPAVRTRAAEKRLKVVDATCPFVERAHRAAREFAARGLPVVVIGDRNHAEVRGIMGEVDPPRQPTPGGRIGVVCQTSMDADEVARRVEALRREYQVEAMAEVCTATRERQHAVRQFDGDALLVLGSRTSANTSRLRAVARCPAFSAANMDEVVALRDELSRFDRVGVTSGAATPERFFERAVDALREAEGPKGRKAGI